jgi:hypothetical protein
MQAKRDAALCEKFDAQTKHAAARHAVEADMKSAAVEDAENEAAVIAAEERWVAAGRLYPPIPVCAACISSLLCAAILLGEWLFFLFY